MKGSTGFIIGALLVAILVLGYFFYNETKNDASVTIEVPNVSVD
ncbi:MAG: hypothetical protein ACRBCJ_03410 [Hyphomicrobiaceae bacterium]